MNNKEVNMAKSKEKPKSPDQNELLATINTKLEIVSALLLRLINDEALDKWEKQDRPNIVNMLIKAGLENGEISRISGLSYGSVANIRSKAKGGKRK